ncbi:MAG TPA: prolipoprotein diacylglyceryl transferase [Alphaproteobacteria bacterium]|nr:prolipoprotein diacylglyceryl transferase [Alphaproteobacteria bacterium]
MPLFTLAFPDFNPIALSLGPFVIRWYALAYVVGLILGWRYVVLLASRHPGIATKQEVDDLLLWATLGVLLGGRIGYILFYNFAYYFHHPVEMFALWRGGMSFHGGLAGVLIAVALFCRLRRRSFLRIGDLVAAAAPIGLFFGRLTNFVNGELYGRPTDVAWAMVFPRDPFHLPRHPSQLYEAALEGVLLFTVLAIFAIRGRAADRPGLLGGIFLFGYGLCRIFSEFFREPDPQLGFLWGGATMGQILSIPVALAGVWLIVRALTRPPVPKVLAL